MLSSAVELASERLRFAAIRGDEAVKQVCRFYGSWSPYSPDYPGNSGEGSCSDVAETAGYDSQERVWKPR